MVTQISNSSAMQISAGRQPSERPFDPSVALNKAIGLSSSSLKAHRANLHTSEETLAKTSPWDSVNGNKLIYEADYEQELAPVADILPKPNESLRLTAFINTITKPADSTSAVCRKLATLMNTRQTELYFVNYPLKGL